MLEQLRPELESIRPWPAVFDQQYVKRLSGPNVKTGTNKRELADQVIADIREFKSANQLDRLVMVWCGSTEVFMTQAPVHQSLAAFEEGLERSDRAIPSSMIYAYAAIKEGVPYANAAPNLPIDKFNIDTAPPVREGFAIYWQRQLCRYHSVVAFEKSPNHIPS